MIDGTKAFSGFSVKDVDETIKFYGTTLGLQIVLGDMGMTLQVGGGNPIFVYQKEDHTPASFTILNFEVEDIDETVNELKEKGVTFLSYPEMTDQDGIARGKAAKMGPDIAWFKDPSGNILSILSN